MQQEMPQDIATDITTLATDLSETEQLHQASNLPYAPQDNLLVVDAAQVPLSGGTDASYGEVRWRTLIDSCSEKSRDMVLGIAEFEPHGRLLPHRHDPAEFYLGLEGSGIVTIDGTPHEMRPGVAIYVPANAEHDTKAGPDGLKFAYGFAEGSFEQITYRFTATTEAQA
ncbi:cupin domain-containing protein [Pseudophaeobacter sp.]|uniref:cupin domain-containing protein n=1 Tax=Pseudophaeobacter sp. TaxID=1971739 RepID=UPI003296F4CC